MKRKGQAVQYPPGVGGVMGKFYNGLLEDGRVDSKLLGQVLDSCATLTDKVNFLNALLLQPPTDQQQEWIEAFGLSWRWTDIIVRAKNEYDVVQAAYGDATAGDDCTIN